MQGVIRRTRGKAPRQEAERLGSALPPLLVEAERVAQTVAQGVHGRRRVGQGETFWQFRRYQPGDPITAIDWRQTAKSQAVFVRETEWEAAQSIWLWRDSSPSMDYASGADLPPKRERAELLLLATAALLVRGGERVALLGSDQLPSTGRAGFNRLADSVLAAADGRNLPPAAELSRAAHLVLFGDFLLEPDEIQSTVSRLAARGVRGQMVQIFDPAEESLPFKGRVRFSGFENEGQTLLGRVENVRAGYRERLARHRETLAQIARRAGWGFIIHHTDRPPQTALLPLYTAMAGTVEHMRR